MIFPNGAAVRDRRRPARRLGVGHVPGAYLDQRRAVGLQLDRDVLDPETLPKQGLQVTQDVLAVRDVLDEHVGAQRVPSRGQRPDVEVMDRPDAVRGPHRRGHGLVVRVAGPAHLADVVADDLAALAVLERHHSLSLAAVDSVQSP